LWCLALPTLSSAVEQDPVGTSFFRFDLAKLQALGRSVTITTPEDFVSYLDLPLDAKKMLLAQQARLAQKSVRPTSLSVVKPPENSACQGRVCAGAATRLIDPFQAELPTLPPMKPSYKLHQRFPAGMDHASLVGLGARFNTHPLEVIFKLRKDIAHDLEEPQFYSHFFLPSTKSLWQDEQIFNNTKALIVKDVNDQYLFLVKCDLIGVFQTLRMEVIELLNSYGYSAINQSNFIITATHTHGGFGSWDKKIGMQIGIDLYNTYMHDFLLNSIGAALMEAYDGMVPAKLGSGQGDLTSVTESRRETCTALGDAPSPQPDPILSVFRVDRAADDTPIAVMFNFPTHGTAAGDTTDVNPDNMGWIERNIEDNLPGRPVALFFNGAEGDVRPRDIGMKAIGNQAGSSVINVRSNIATTDDMTLNVAYCQDDDPNLPPTHEYACPRYFGQFEYRFMKQVEIKDEGYQDCFYDREPEGPAIKISKKHDDNLFDRDGITYTGVKMILKFGDQTKKIGFTTMPGEAITDIGLAIRAGGKAAGYDEIYPLGLANSWIAYITTPEEYDQGGYEAVSTLFGRDTGTVVIENAISVLQAAMNK
jgi:hypothetical protein